MKRSEVYCGASQINERERHGEWQDGKATTTTTTMATTRQGQPGAAQISFWHLLNPMGPCP
jgi:hypothetical protein